MIKEQNQDNNVLPSYQYLYIIYHSLQHLLEKSGAMSYSKLKYCFIPWFLLISFTPSLQIIAFDELKTDYKNPIDQCNTLNPVSNSSVCTSLNFSASLTACRSAPKYICFRIFFPPLSFLQSFLSLHCFAK